MSTPSRLNAPSMTGSETGPTAPGPDSAVQAPNALGQRLGRYELRELVGSGGMGLVYAAWDPQLQRKVALKVLRPGLGEQQRLLREAQALARLSHPHIITVYDAGVVGEQLFIALELVEGETLAAWLARERRSWREVVEVYAQAGQGLAAAHSVSVVHCDFKPDNVLLGAGGRVLVLDFGIALVGEEPSGATPALGTPAYMAPEQHASRGAVDARADQYSFCLALYEGLYGQRPFERTRDVELLAALKRAEALRPPPPATRVPAHVHRALVRGLRAAPEERWPSMQQLLAELRRDVWRSLRRRLLAGGLVATYLAGFAAAWALREHTAASTLCKDGARQLAGVWDESLRARTRQAILASGGASAQDTWSRVEQGLNHYSTRWVASYESACAATHVRKVQSPQLLDHRMACLEGRLRSMATLLSLLRQGDKALTREAPRLLYRLPELETCTDTQVLLRDQPLPEESEQRRQVHALRRKLEEAQVLFNAGRYTEALEASNALAEPITALGYLPLRAELERLRGHCNHKLVRNELALEQLYEALWAAEASRHDDVAASALSLLYILDTERARLYERADAAILRSGHSEYRVQLAVADGGRAFNRGSYAQALAHFQRALALQEQHRGPDHPYITTLLNNIAAAHEQLGEYALAEAAISRTVALAERLFGEQHPEVLLLRINEASLQVKLGQYSQALEQLEHALEPARQEFGTGHGIIQGSLLTRAEALFGLGQLSQAEVPLRELLYGSGAPAPAHFLHVEGTELLGRLLIAQGQPERARAPLQGALKELHRQGSHQPAREALLLTTLAQAWLHQGHVGKARPLLERARHLQQQALTPYHPAHASVLLTFSELSARQGRCREAEDSWGQALSLRQRSLGPEHPLTRALREPPAPCAGSPRAGSRP